jgi:hypothetical protein
MTLSLYAMWGSFRVVQGLMGRAHSQLSTLRSGFNAAHCIVQVDAGQCMSHSGRQLAQPLDVVDDLRPIA